MLITLLLSLGLAGAAQAATLTTDIVTGLTYTTGDPITINLVATITPPEPDSSLIMCCEAQLLGSGAIAWSGVTQTPLTTFNGNVPFITFAPVCTGGDPCAAIIQFNPAPGNPLQPDPFDGVLATATGTIVGAPGTYDVQLQADFFGPTSTTSTTITIVPEPGTAALLLLGLLGLDVGRRTRAA